MSWTGSTPEQMGKRKAFEDFKAGRPMKVNLHWPPSVRAAYRDTYARMSGKQT